MCDSCEVLNINGVNCHEHGCPDAWMDQVRECKWCGSAFQPEEKGQWFCDDDCDYACNSQTNHKQEKGITWI